MSYIAEELAELSPADLRAWALSQVSHGDINIRIAEAETLIRWMGVDTSPQAGETREPDAPKSPSNTSDDLTGLGGFIFPQSNPLSAQNIEQDPLDQKISARQLKAFLMILGKTSAAIGRPELAAQLGPWVVGYLAGWSTPLVELHVDPGCRPVGNASEVQLKETHAECISDSGSAAHQSRHAECSSDSSSGCADGESAGELPTPSRTDDALPLKHAASVTVFDAEENEAQS